MEPYGISIVVRPLDAIESYTRMSESRWRIVRFIIAGGAATAVSTLALQISVSVFQVWYVFGSVIGFFCGFFVSFTLQKFWTFRDTRGSTVMAKQAAMYLALIAINLVSNTTFVYLGVEFGGLTPVVAQICTSLVLAVQNFLVYRFIIFRPSLAPAVQSQSTADLK